MIERTLALDCFGGTVSLRASCGEARAEATDRLLRACARRLLGVHSALTRFDPDSELCRLNADPRELVPASPLLRRLAAAVPYAGRLSGGLVDATCLPALERAGYQRPLREARPRAGGESRPQGPGEAGRWAEVSDDRLRRAVRRPAGVRIDSGGLAKGMAADLLSPLLERLPAYVIDCCGDMRIGGRARMRRPVEVSDPWGAGAVEQLSVAEGAVATSGVTARSWANAGGPAHHLIDPQRGTPASTDLAQATALAPTALEAEIRAKAAVLAGRRAASAHLPHGGLLVTAGGRVEMVEAAAS